MAYTPWGSLAKKKPIIQNQGKCIIEVQDNGECLLMSPDGEVQVCLNEKQAEKKARQWFKDHCDARCMGLGFIEWRGEKL